MAHPCHEFMVIFSTELHAGSGKLMSGPWKFDRVSSSSTGDDNRPPSAFTVNPKDDLAQFMASLQYLCAGPKKPGGTTQEELEREVVKLRERVKELESRLQS